jgi:hypothetical protein
MEPSAICIYTYSDPLYMVERRDPKPFRCENVQIDVQTGMSRYNATHLIPDKPLAALNCENRAEDAHGGMSSAGPPGARVRDVGGLGGGGIRGGIISALLALVTLLLRIARFFTRGARR